MIETISWLHLTDLHVGQANEWLWQGMRQQFYEDLRLMASSTGPWDVVFFSGDFVQTGSVEEFRKLTAELERLWKHFRALGSNPLLVCVPGNHDVLRPGDTDPITRQSMRWHELAEEDVKHEFWTKKQSKYRKGVERSLKHYSDWLKSLKLPKPKLIKGLLPGDFSAVVQRNNTYVGIVGLNTTFLQLGKGDYEKKLDLHVLQLHAVSGDDPQTWRECVDLAILMTHQPASWLSPAATQQLTEIYSLGRFDSHMSGHLHNAKMHDTSVAGGPVRRLRQGASLFGLEKFGISQVRPLFGYMLGRWEFDGTQVQEFLWPRSAAFTHGGVRQLGPDRGYSLDLNNRLVTTFQIVRSDRSGACDALPNLLPSPEELSAEWRGETDEPTADSVSKQSSGTPKVRSIPRWRAFLQEQHRAIRDESRQQLASALGERRVAWLVTDWGLGKEGFLASALDEYGSHGDTFVLQCGDAKTCADLQSLPDTQLGLSFQEFFALIGDLQSPVLILDDLPTTFATGPEREALDTAIIQPIRDFAANLGMIFVVRQKPRLTEDREMVILHALDVHETRDYLRSHPDASPDLIDEAHLDKVQDWSEGLPMQLEYLVEKTRGCSLSDFLDEKGEITVSNVEHGEPVPRGLQDAIETLTTGEDEVSRQSFLLLKILSVLRDGEVFQSVRRFYPTKPFHVDNVSRLLKLDLLEVVTIARTAVRLRFGAGRAGLSLVEEPKLLHVPPQVRTFVLGLIPKDEHDAILRTSTELLFGKTWRTGTIHLRKDLERSYSESAIATPGNERFVAQYLVREALGGDDELQLSRSVQLGLALCSKLLVIDRFRDALLATQSMVQLLRETPLTKEYAEAARLHGNALRMLDEHEPAIDMQKLALDKGSPFYTNDLKGTIFLELALSYETLDQDKDAQQAADKVLTLSGPESSDGFQAQAIIARLTIKDPDELEKQLLVLLRDARRKGHHTTANNIALDLIRRGKATNESLRRLDDVFRTAKGNYTRARAIINKASLLTSLGRESDLEEADRELLGAAYSYSYGQRIPKLLERSHVALWNIFSKEGIFSGMLRLFRLSSFFWRLKGTPEQESKYIRQLDSVDLDQLKRVEGRTLDNEIHYLERRRQDLPPPETS